MQIIKTNKHTYFLNEVEPSGRSMEVLLLRDWLILIRPPLIAMRGNCSKRVRLLPPHSFWVLEFGLAVYFYSHSPTITMSQSRDRRARCVQILHSPREQSGWETDSDKDTEAGDSVWPAILTQCPPSRRCSSCRQQLPSPLQPHSTAIKPSFCLQELQWQELWRGSLCRVTGVHSVFASVVDILERGGRIANCPPRNGKHKNRENFPHPCLRLQQEFLWCWLYAGLLWLACGNHFSGGLTNLYMFI